MGQQANMYLERFLIRVGMDLVARSKPMLVTGHDGQVRTAEAYLRLLANEMHPVRVPDPREISDKGPFLPFFMTTKRKAGCPGPKPDYGMYWDGKTRREK